MVDRVRPLKLEDTGTGTQTDLFPTSLNRNEDFLDSRGLTIQNDAASNDEAVRVERDGSGNLMFVDQVQTTPVSLNTLVPVFGTEYDYAEDLPESSESGQTYVQQFRYTTGNLPAGTYNFEWVCEFKGTNASRAVGLLVQQDDTTDLYEDITIETDWYHPFTAFHELSLSGVHNFDFDIRRVANQAVTATIRNIRVRIWRVV